MRTSFNNAIFAGIIASLLLLLGDVLFYERWIIPLEDVFALKIIRIPYESLSALSNWRIYTNIFLAFLCTLLYLRSSEIFRFIYYDDQNFEKTWSINIYKSIGITIGLAHLAYVAIAVAIKSVPEYGEDVAKGLIHVFDCISLIAVILSVLLSVVYIPNLLLSKTRLPFWTLFFFPTVFIPILIGITFLFPNHLLFSIIQGASINLGMLIYFILLLLLRERLRR